MRPLNPLILRVLYMLRFCSLITMVLDANTYGFRTQNLWYCKGSLINRNDSDAGFVDMIINKTGNIITISPALMKIYLLSLLMKIAQRYTENTGNTDK